MTDNKFEEFKVDAPTLSFDEVEAVGKSVEEKLAEAEAAVASKFSGENVVEVAADAIEIIEEDAPAEGEATEAGTEIEEVKHADPINPEDTLTSEELAQVKAFVNQIDINNTTAIMNYGVGTQKKIADFSEKALENVKTKDMGEVGNMISSLVTELKTMDKAEESKGLFGFFKKKTNNLATMKAKYNKVESNVETIKNELENRQIQLMKDSAMLDNMYDLNMNYFKELTMYIVAGQQKLEEVKATELAALEAKAEESGLAEDAQAAKDLSSQIERFEKKLYDLQLTRNISMQTAPQIRMIQASDNLMAEKIQSTIVNTIPLWKNQMVIAMGVEHSVQAAQAQHEVTEMTNELLKENAEKLQMATIETAKESERGIIDVETLRQTNETLINTLDEVINIQREGREARAAAEAELKQIEGDLKEKLLEAAKQYS